MKRNSLVLAGALLALFPLTANADATKPTAPKPAAHTKMAAATTYKCVKCGMTFTAAEAKKDHYKCTMDGGKLVPVKSAAKAPKNKMTM